MNNFRWEEISFKNNRSQKLAGLFYTRGEEKSPTLIVCHGFTGSKEGGGQACRMAEYFSSAGYDTLLFDFAGNGDSEGIFEELTLSGQIDDLESAVTWCLERGAGKIVTMGRSFGGTTVICHAAWDNRVSAVCTWAAAARLVELFTSLVDDDPDDPRKLMVAGENGILYLRRSFLDDIKRYDVMQLASRLAPRPLLLIHGTEDEVVPPNDAQLLYDAAGDNKELVYIEGGNHQLENHRQQVWDTCLRWLKKINSAAGREA